MRVASRFERWRADPRTPVRLTLAIAVVVGLLTAVSMPLTRPDQVGIATDVYAVAGQAVLDGGDPYARTPPGMPGFRFVYPPIVLVAVVPYGLVGPTGAYVAQTALNLLTATALGLLLVRRTAATVGDLARVDRILIAGVAVGSVHATTVYVMGQVNLQLALLVASGAVLVERAARSDASPERGHNAGVAAAGGAAVAAAASVKLFPAVVGAWLVRQRAWRAIAGAVGTGVGLALLGVLAVGPSRTVTYLTTVLPAERQQDVFAGTVPADATFVTIRRPIAALLPDADPTLVAVLGLAVLGPLVVLALRRVRTPRDRELALLATLAAPLAFLPLEPFYFSLVLYPLVVVLYRLDRGRARAALLWATLLISAPVTYPSVASLLGLGRSALGGWIPAPSAIRPVFTVVQPPLVGVLAILVVCAILQWRGPDTAVEMDQ